ncbi:tetratricopeptide repeat protein [Streptomyces sp. AP-93]|uniref:tetratricopeptide repeat protein n=1 Tax=Streptomyces sp. AP-93 TaxID=2929048 RepID=UPI0027E52D4A|nr:tetratricopeptide repeat protein [Streptomyces sp. AP-93]
MSAEQRARAEGQARITQVTVAGDYVAHPPGAAPPAPTSPGLPAPPAPFVGREGAVKELTDLLEKGGDPVTVVAGLPGIGKSALALATAHRALEYGWFEERVFFLQLSGYAPNGATSGPQAVQELLRCLGIGESDVPPSPEGQVALYRARLAALARDGQRVLIVADDAGSVSQVRDLVPADATHRLLVTSRHQLLAPGFTPRLISLDELAAGPAVELLKGMLRRSRPQDPRPDTEPEALARIAERCGRLPLALTVAGALLAGDPGLPAAELARQLTEARSRLEKLHVDGLGDGDVPVGVRVAFDLSYARLPADQARIFRLLTVVPGPDTSTLYAALVTGYGELEDLTAAAARLRPALAALVRASLLMEQPVGSGRWRMHDLVRLYALERGEECAQQDGRERAIERFLARLLAELGGARAALGLGGRPQTGRGFSSATEALHWFEAERLVASATVGFAAETGRCRDALLMAVDLGEYFKIYGYRRELLVMTRQVVEAARRGGDRLILGVALSNYGPALVDGGREEEGVEQLREALPLLRETFREGEGKVLADLGQAYSELDRFEEAREASEEALRIFRELGSLHDQGPPLARLAYIHSQTGRADESVDAFRQAIGLMRETGDRHREASWSTSLAIVLWRFGHRQESLAVAERALALRRELGHRDGVAWSLTWLAKSLVDAGHPQEAVVRLEEAAALFGEVGDHVRQAPVLSNLGLLYLKAGRLEEGLESAERAHELFAGTGQLADEARAAQLMALGLAQLHRRGEAVRAFERAAECFGEVGLSQKEADCREVAAALRQEGSVPAQPPGAGGRVQSGAGSVMAATTEDVTVHVGRRPQEHAGSAAVPAQPPVAGGRRWRDRLRPRPR